VQSIIYAGMKRPREGPAEAPAGESR
jgi:hypothetical protein